MSNLPESQVVKIISYTTGVSELTKQKYLYFFAGGMITLEKT
jgi:hypothetical protein